MKTYSINRIGICDIDAYGILWYGNYHKYYLQALEEITPFTDFTIISMRFKEPMKWGDEAYIESYVVQQYPLQFLQKFKVGERVLNFQLIEISTSDILKIEQFSKKDQMLIHQLKNTKIPAAYLGHFDISFPIYREMFVSNKENTYLSLHTILDCFEQTRTESICGQKELSRFKTDSKCLFVVSKMFSLKRYPFKKHTERMITSRVTLVENLRDSCFLFKHELLSKDNYVLASCYLQLCCFNEETKRLQPITPRVKTHFLGNLKNEKIKS